MSYPSCEEIALRYFADLYVTTAITVGNEVTRVYFQHRYLRNNRERFFFFFLRNSSLFKNREANFNFAKGATDYGQFKIDYTSEQRTATGGGGRVRKVFEWQ